MTSSFLDAVLGLFDPGSPYLRTSEKTVGELALFFSRFPNHRESLEQAMQCYVAKTEFRPPVGLQKASYRQFLNPLNTPPSHIQRRPTADPFSSFRLIIYLGCKYSDSEPLLQPSRRLNFHKRYMCSALCLNAILYGIRPRFSLALLVQSLPEKYSQVLDLINYKQANSIHFISPAL